MRKSGLALTFLAALFFAAGCAEERIPADKADLWEAAENPPPPPPAGNNTVAGSAGADTASQPAEAAASNAAAAPDGAVVVVKGSALMVEGENSPVADGDFTRAHYFEAFAPLELNAPATSMETDIEGQNVSGAVPVIGLFVLGEDGTTHFANNARPIDGKQQLKDKLNLAPGKYRVRLTYFKDTVGEIRPRISVKTIIFR